MAYMVEQEYFAVKEALVKACQGDIHLWPDKLRAASFADNVTVREFTEYSAYFLLHGTDPMLPFDLWKSTFLVDGFQQVLTSQELLTLRIWQIEHCDEDVTRAMQILRNS